MLFMCFGLLKMDVHSTHNVNFGVGGYKLKVKLIANVKITTSERWKALAKGGGLCNFKHVGKGDCHAHIHGLIHDGQLQAWPSCLLGLV